MRHTIPAVNLTLDSILRVFRTKVPGFIFAPGVRGHKAAELIHSATDTVMIATTKGAFRSKDRGDKWERLALPDQGTDIWSITVDPTDKRTVYAGCGPVGVYRSDNGGDTWHTTKDPALPNRVIMDFACRVMRLDVDPNNPDDVYATLEANGTMRSRDDCASLLITVTARLGPAAQGP